MTQPQMTYEEFAEDLANAYPDLDLQEITVDDIKIMMSHTLKFEPNTFGLTPASEYEPSSRRRRSRQRSRTPSATSTMHVVGSDPGEANSDEEAYAAAAFLEQNMNRGQETQNVSQLENLGAYNQNFSDMSKLPLATVQALYASAALLSFSRGQSVVSPPKYAENVPSTSSTMADDSVASSSFEGETSATNKTSSFSTCESQESLGSVDIDSRSGMPVQSHSQIGHISQSRRGSQVQQEYSPSLEQMRGAERRKSVPGPSNTTGSSEKLRQLLQVGYQELVHKWAEEEAEQNENNSAATDKETAKEQKQSQMEQLKTMNPGHLEDGVFKIPADKITQQSHGLELDTPPPSQTLPVNFAYAPNVAIRMDTALPLTPPQASPPEVSMAEMTSAQLSNMMSKHLLSTTHGVRTSSVLGRPMDAVMVSFPAKDLCAQTTLTGLQQFVSTPTTQISYLPMLNVAPGNQQPAIVTTEALQAAHNLMPINGMFHTDTVPPITSQPKPTPKKSKKRRRKSDSSESYGSLGSPLDGSPRLIKKIGRVIQTVENEQDLNMKVDAMLKNIMGKFQQRQSESSTSTTHGDEVQSQMRSHAGTLGQTFHQTFVSPQAPQMGVMSVAGVTHPPKPSPKRKSRSKKKAVVSAADTVATNHSVLESSSLLGMHVPVQSGDGGVSNQMEQFIQLPPNLTSSEAIAAASIAALSANQGLTALSEPQTLLQTIPTSGLTVNPLQFSEPANLNVNHQNLGMSSMSMIPANQLMPTADALEAARKMLLDAGITIPAVTKPMLTDYQHIPDVASPGFAIPGVPIPSTAQFSTQLTHAVIDSSPLMTSQTGGSHFVTSPGSTSVGNPPNTQLHLQNPKAKKRKKKPAEKLNDVDIAKIAGLLAMSNTVHFAEFFNRLQAFAVGNNPDWIIQYPNIAKFVDVEIDSCERAKQMLDYLREKTGMPEGQDMVVPPEQPSSSSSALKPANIVPALNASVISTNSNVTPPIPSQNSVPQKLNDAKLSLFNGIDGHDEPTFIENFQNFLHNSNAAYVPAPVHVPKSKKSSRSSKSSQSSNKLQSNVWSHVPGVPQISSTGLATHSLSSPGTRRLPLDTSMKTLTKSEFNPFGMKSTDNKMDFDNSAIKDMLHDSSLVERLKSNYGNQIEEIPKCKCLKGASYDEAREGAYYTHLGAGPDVHTIRKLMQTRLDLNGRAVRIEKVLHTNKEGKSTQGCPVPRWVLRRSGPEEKVLCIVRSRPGHQCNTAVLVIGVILWEALTEPNADALYTYLKCTLPKTGGGNTRRRANQADKADKLTCKCRGLNDSGNGATFNFGCGWSTFCSGCKYTKSTATPRKFKIGKVAEERVLEERLNRLASDLTPLCQRTVPDAYKTMVQFEGQALECRLGAEHGRPFSTVKTELDHSSHSHKERSHIEGGCSVIVTLTENGAAKNDIEQLHVLPMCILDTTAEPPGPNGPVPKLCAGVVAYHCETPVTPKSLKRSGSSKKRRKVAKKKSSVFKRRSKVIPQDLIERLNLKSVKRTPGHSMVTRRTVNKARPRQLQRAVVAQRTLRHTTIHLNLTQKPVKTTARRKRKAKLKSADRSGKNKRWQEMMNDPAFVNNLMTVGQKMYGHEAESMVGRLKSVAEQDRATQDASGTSQPTTTVCSNQGSSAQNDSGYKLRSKGSSKKSARTRRVTRLRRPASTPSQDSQPMYHSQSSSRPRSCTPTGNRADGSKPEDVAGWGMYSMPPNRSVFDIASPRKSISTELLHSVNRHGSQTRILVMPHGTDAEETTPSDGKIEECINNALVQGSSTHNAFADLKQSPVQIHRNNSHSIENGPIQNETDQSNYNRTKEPAFSGQLQTTGGHSQNEQSFNLADILYDHANSINSSELSKHSGQEKPAYGNQMIASNTGGSGVQHMFKTDLKSFTEANVGGVAIALTHGSVLFAVSKREFHARTTVRKEDSDASCISLEFHQQKGLNLPQHGHEEYLQLEEYKRQKRDRQNSFKVEKLEMKVEVKEEEDAVVSALSSYKYLWDTAVARAETQTTNCDMTYSWLKPQTAVSGPYQRWV